MIHEEEESKDELRPANSKTCNGFKFKGCKEHRTHANDSKEQQRHSPFFFFFFFFTCLFVAGVAYMSSVLSFLSLFFSLSLFLSPPPPPPPLCKDERGVADHEVKVVKVGLKRLEHAQQDLLGQQRRQMPHNQLGRRRKEERKRKRRRKRQEAEEGKGKKVEKMVNQKAR